MKRSLLLVCSLTLLLTSARIANACSCGQRPTVLDAFDAAEEVIVARVTAIEVAPPEDRHYYVDGIRSTTLVVEKVYKGSLKIRDEVVFAQGGGADCIWTFDADSVNQQFLFYLKRPAKDSGFPTLSARMKNLWYAGTCGRSSAVETAAEDLLYLDNVDRLRGKTRISGTIRAWPNPDIEVEGRTINIIGPRKTYKTKTNKDGVFEIYNLPPGRYLLEPETPAGWKIDREWLAYSASVVADDDGRAEMKSPRQVPIMLEPKKHASVDLVFTIENFVRGRVIGPDGKPLTNVCVYLLSPGREAWGPFDCTDDQGRFEITSGPRGEYVLVANQDNKLSSREPFHRVFYPNVKERERAAVIAIGAGDVVENLDIVVPKLEETLIIEGVMRYADGKPAADEWIEFNVTEKDDNVEGDIREKTDSRGRFALRVLKGLTGELSSEKSVWRGEYKNCPAVDEPLAANSQGVTIRTNVIKVRTDTDVHGVELIMPIPRCEKSDN